MSFPEIQNGWSACTRRDRILQKLHKVSSGGAWLLSPKQLTSRKPPNALSGLNQPFPLVENHQFFFALQEYLSKISGYGSRQLARNVHLYTAQIHLSLLLGLARTILFGGELESIAIIQWCL
jgi:hypothetical protein